MLFTTRSIFWVLPCIRTGAARATGSPVVVQGALPPACGLPQDVSGQMKERSGAAAADKGALVGGAVLHGFDKGGQSRVVFATAHANGDFGGEAEQDINGGELIQYKMP